MAQIKERLTILLTLAAFSIAFLCCRELNAIPAVYVGVNCMRANIVMTVMYYAGDINFIVYGLNIIIASNFNNNVVLCSVSGTQLEAG